jgi:hypothetical protein
MNITLFWVKLIRPCRFLVNKVLPRLHLEGAGAGDLLPDISGLQRAIVAGKGRRPQNALIRPRPPANQQIVVSFRAIGAEPVRAISGLKTERGSLA